MVEIVSPRARASRLWRDIRRFFATILGARKGELGRIVGLFLAACVLTACDQQAAIDQAPPEDLDFAKQYVALFQKSDFAAIEAASNPGMRNPQFRPTLMLMATMIPAEAPTSIEVVGADITTSAENSKTTSLKIQYKFSAAWLLVDIAVSRANGAAVVDYIYFTPMASSWKEVNAFTLGGKPVLSFLVLGISVFVVVFMVASLIFALVTPIPKRKWLWCILVFLGMGFLDMNWTTGEIDFRILSFGVNIGFGRLGVEGPYYVQTYVPVGAIVFWIRRRAWMRDQADSPSRIAERF